MERREAQRPTLLAARAPGPPPPRTTLGSRNLGATADPAPGPSKGPRTRPLAPPGAPSPRWGKREKGTTGAERRKTTGGRSVGCLRIESETAMTGQEKARPTGPGLSFQRNAYKRNAY